MDGKPVVKVIDFGLAKATNQRLTERALFTEEGRIIGMPEYMSPEQAESSAQEVDQRTDVFSLGVVLYELIAARHLGADIARRMERESGNRCQPLQVSEIQHYEQTEGQLRVPPARYGREVNSTSKDVAGLRASLVCAGANVPNSSSGAHGMLTAEEVAWMDLTRVRLVVLSACETALGSAVADNVMSLRRAFHLAGAREVISSMWRVDDLATSTLMQDFYDRHLRQGSAASAALRAARLAMLAAFRQQPGGAPRPETWGAFVYSVVR
ncbi:MAG: CHAT domain-containing protein [Planctomycetota bacterium]